LSRACDATIPAGARTLALVLGSLTDRLPRIRPRSRTGRVRSSSTGRPISISREVLLFVIGCALAAALIGGASFWVVNGAATSEAIDNAEVITQIDANGIVAPLLTPALLAGSPAAISAVDAAVVGRVLSSRVVRVKIWTAAGKVVYSDAHGLIGQTFALGDDEQEALADSKTDSEVSDLSRPENRFERGFGSLVEVYLPVRATDGTKLLFETYQLDSVIQADQQRIWGGIFPALVAGLGLLFIVQVPLSWRLALRLQRASRDRAALLQRAIDSSETERWRIAGDLHDGPVQNLTAVSLTLGSAAMRMSDPQRESPTHDELVSVMQAASSESRTAIRELRTMIMEIAPPDLNRGGLDVALGRLVSVANEQGVTARLEVDAMADSHPVDDIGLVYRTAQESVRNVLKHAQAANVTIRLSKQQGRLTLEVIDDGCGFTPDDLRRRQQNGHVGLSLLQERVAEAEATISITSVPGRGTAVRLQLAQP
jgi:two-component system, NarL family, sensor kinase